MANVLTASGVVLVVLLFLTQLKSGERRCGRIRAEITPFMIQLGGALRSRLQQFSALKVFHKPQTSENKTSVVMCCAVTAF